MVLRIGEQDEARAFGGTDDHGHVGQLGAVQPPRTKTLNRFMAGGAGMRPGVPLIALPQPCIAVVDCQLNAVGGAAGLCQLDTDALIDGAARPKLDGRLPGKPTGDPQRAVDTHVQRGRAAVEALAGIVPAAAAVHGVEHVRRPPAADQAVDGLHRHGLDTELQLVAAGDRHHAVDRVPGRLDGGPGVAAGLGGLAAGLAHQVDTHLDAIQVDRHRGAYRVVQ
ncbi:hypothetical protein D9M68_696410 [compost metagenome]